MATVKKVKKAMAGTTTSQTTKKPTPTYKNLKMGVKNENYLMSGMNKDITPSSKDSFRYRGGFEQGLKGSKGMPNEGQVEKMGRWEGQNVGKKAKAKKGAVVKSKMKMGGKVKKAQSGTVERTAYKTNKNFPGGKETLATHSMDTTGYAGGRKNFTVNSKYSTGKSKSSEVKTSCGSTSNKVATRAIHICVI